MDSASGWVRRADRAIEHVRSIRRRPPDCGDGRRPCRARDLRSVFAPATPMRCRALRGRRPPAPAARPRSSGATPSATTGRRVFADYDPAPGGRPTTSSTSTATGPTPRTTTSETLVHRRGDGLAPGPRPARPVPPPRAGRRLAGDPRHELALPARSSASSRRLARRHRDRHAGGPPSRAYHAAMPTMPDRRPAIPTAPILVVDDDAKIVRLVRTYLEREGYRVVTAADGPAALDAIETHEPALVVLDLMLPELDGRAVIRAVRRDEAAARTPILVLSARELDHRPHRRSRGRRRRLPAQAVLAGRAGPARQVDPAPDDGDRGRPGTTASPAEPAPRQAVIRHADLTVDPVAPRGPPRRRHDHRPDPGRVPPAPGHPRRRRPGPVARPAPRRGLRPRGGRGPGPHHRRPHPPPARQARRRPRRAALRPDRPGRRLSGRPDVDPVIARGLAGRIALAAIASAAVGLVILAVGVAVVGARRLHRADDGSRRLGRARPGHVRRLGHDRGHHRLDRGRRRQHRPGRRPRPDARPARSTEIGAAARRIADGDYAARVPRDGPGGAGQPGRLVQPDGRLPRAARRRCAATSSPTPPTSCARR